MGTWDDIFIDDGFVEHTYFEGNAQYRRLQQKLFMEGDIYAPAYDYPKLSMGNFFIFNKARSHAKTMTLKALSYHLGEDKAQLYHAKLKHDYKKRLLVETAEKLRKSPVGSRGRIAAEKKFRRLNRELFGKVDKKLFYGLLRTEWQQAYDFVPKDDYGAMVRQNVLKLLDHIPSDYAEPVLLSQKLLDRYSGLMQSRYGNIMDAVGEHEGKYDAEECVVIMNRALRVGGLYDEGWRVLVDPEKSVPATFAGERRIFLPIHTRRTSDELRRLILHEQEVHARRARNGSRYNDLPLLEKGTARSTDVEEGLGVFLEAIACGCDKNPAIERARQRYIHVGLALGTDGTMREAFQVYDITWRLNAIRLASERGYMTDKIVRKAKSQAMVHIENIFRGTDFVTPGLCYTKAKVYYEGLLKNVKRARKIAADTTLFDQQFIGKYDHTNRRERDAVLAIIK